MRCHHTKFINLGNQTLGNVHPCFGGVRQGSGLSAEVLNVVMDRIIRRASERWHAGIPKTVVCAVGAVIW
jgi:hypothetical protein